MTLHMLSTNETDGTTITIFEVPPGRLVREVDLWRETWFAVRNGCRSGLYATAAQAEQWLRA